MNILIVKLGALGDVINTLPAVINLKEQTGAKIHWLVEPLSYPLIKNHAFVDNVIVFDKHHWHGSLGNVVQKVRKQKFDIAIDLQRIVKSALLCLAAKAERRLGFDKARCKEMSWIFPFERIPASDPKAHMVHQYLEFASHLGLNTSDIRWEIPLTGKHPFDLPEDYIVLNIGATKPANRWTPQGFASLAEVLHDKHKKVCVLTGAGEDLEMARAIGHRIKFPVFDLVGKTTLPELVEILAGAEAVVSCDTGPMHLAVALGRDVVALFGPADPKRTGPFRGEVVQKILSCAPCNQRICEDPVCMSTITANDVLERLERLWSV